MFDNDCGFVYSVCECVCVFEDLVLYVYFATEVCAHIQLCLCVVVKIRDDCLSIVKKVTVLMRLTR